MKNRLAQGVIPTGSSQRARIRTLSSDTSLFIGTLHIVRTGLVVTADKLSAVSDAFSFGASGRSTIGYRSFVGTFRVWITTWIQRWTVAFRFVKLRYPANGIRSAAEVVTFVGLLSFAQTTLFGITHASGLAGTLITVCVLPAYCILTAWVLRTAVLLQWLTLLTSVSKEPWSTRALSLSVNDTTLSVDATGSVLQARICTLSYDTLLIQFTVLVRLAFVLYTAFSWITLESIGTQAKCLMICHLTDGISTASLSSSAWIHTLAVNA